MKKLHATLTVLTLGLALVSCGELTTPVPVTSTRVAVTLHLPGLQSTTLNPLGVPTTASSATVRIYDGQRLETTLNLAMYSGNQTVYLQRGVTYRFETSVTDQTKQELAWGSVEQTITDTDHVTLQYRTYLADATLTAAPISGGTVDVNLKALALTTTQWGQQLTPNVPLSDFDVTYDVTGGTLVSTSKLGARIRPDGGPITLTAHVTGQSAARQPVQLDRTLTFDAVLPDASTITGTVEHWPENLNLTATVTSGGHQPSTGRVDASGHLNLPLPDHTTATQDDFTAMFGMVQWTTPPTDVRTLSTLGFDLNSGGKPLGHLEMGSRLIGNDPRPGDRIGFAVIYADRDTTGDGIISGQQYVPGPDGYYTPVPYTLRVHLTLQRGWNVLMGDINAVHPSSPAPVITDADITTAPYDLQTLPGGLTWQANLTNLADLHLDQTIDQPSPIQGNRVQHTVTITNDGPGSPDGSTQLQVILPRGLQYDWNTDSNCWYNGDVTSTTNGTITCWVPVPAHNQQTKVTFITRPELGVTPTPLNVTAQIADSTFVELNPTNNAASVTLNPIPGTATGSVNADFEAPYLYLNRPEAIALGDTLTLTGSSYDFGSGIDKIELYEGVRLIATLDGSTRDWAATWTPDAAGSYTLRAIAYDHAGNTSTADTTLFVQ